MRPGVAVGALGRKGIDRAIDRASMIPIIDLAGEVELDRARGIGRYARTKR
jgi:hypothetical protein